MVALLTYHKGERLSQKNVSLCKSITDLSSSLEFIYNLFKSHQGICIFLASLRLYGQSTPAETDTKSKQRQRQHYIFLIHYILYTSLHRCHRVQSGDIHPHPGPVEQNNHGQTEKRRCRQPKFPCVSCNRGVTSMSKAVSCDMCQIWTHIGCTCFITNSFYNKLVQDELNFNFTCNGCTNKDLPFLMKRISFLIQMIRRLQLQDYHHHRSRTLSMFF